MTAEKDAFVCWHGSDCHGDADRCAPPVKWSDDDDDVNTPVSQVAIATADSTNSPASTEAVRDV